MNSTSRRGFLKAMGIGAVGAGALALGKHDPTPKPPEAPKPVEVETQVFSGPIEPETVIATVYTSCMVSTI